MGEGNDEFINQVGVYIWVYGVQLCWGDGWGKFSVIGATEHSA